MVNNKAVRKLNECKESERERIVSAQLIFVAMDCQGVEPRAGTGDAALSTLDDALDTLERDTTVLIPPLNTCMANGVAVAEVSVMSGCLMDGNPGSKLQQPPLQKVMDSYHISASTTTTVPLQASVPPFTVSTSSQTNVPPPTTSIPSFWVSVATSKSLPSVVVLSSPAVPVTSLVQSTSEPLSESPSNSDFFSALYPAHPPAYTSVPAHGHTTELSSLSDSNLSQSFTQASNQAVDHSYVKASNQNLTQQVEQDCAHSISEAPFQGFTQPGVGKLCDQHVVQALMIPCQESCVNTTHRELLGDGRVSQEAGVREEDVIESHGTIWGCYNFTKKQMTILSSMLLVVFFSYASLSIMAPFFPHQVQKMGMSSTLDGIIFSMYSLALVITSPIIGKFLPLMNLRTAYIGGIFLNGFSDICFGLVSYARTPEVFVLASIILRLMTAIGSSFFLTVIYAVVPLLFPNDMNAVNGMLETVSGLGMCIGPAAGAWLYLEGGFSLPFFCLGTFILLTVPASYFAFPSNEVERGAARSALRVLVQPGALVSLLILFTTAVCLAVLYPTLQPHMSKLGVSVEGVGLVYLLLSASYAVSSPLAGLATDRFVCPFGIMLVGLLLTAVAYILIGNSPLLPHLSHDELYNEDVAGIVLLGLSAAMCIVPTYGAILSIAVSAGDDDINTYSMVGGVWSATYSLGEMLGPLYGGMMMAYVTFATATTLTALLPIAVAVVLGTYKCTTCFPITSE
nr:MFS-type transporter SLC18B1-like isoform X2 [Cherax quadricarinatus]